MAASIDDKHLLALFTLFPVSLQHVAICSNVGATPVPFVALPLTDILIAVSVNACAVTVWNIVVEVAFVCIAVGQS